MGYRRWTSDEDALILSSRYFDKEFAEQLGRTVRAVEVRRYNLRNPGVAIQRVRDWRAANPQRARSYKSLYYRRGAMNGQNAGAPWSSEHDALIMAEGRPTDLELTKQLGRTLRGIEVRRRRLRLRLRVASTS